MKSRHTSVNSNDVQTNIILDRCSREDFQIVEHNGGIAENDANFTSVVFRTGNIPNSWIRAFRSGMPINFANSIRFSFKGNMLEDNSILIRIGVGMEGPNSCGDLSSKFGLQGFNDGGIDGSHYQVITSNGISISSEPTSIPIKNSIPKCYTLTLNPGVSCRITHIDKNREIVSITTCGIPYSGITNRGMSFGIKTLNEAEKKMSLVSASLLTNHIQK